MSENRNIEKSSSQSPDNENYSDEDFDDEEEFNLDPVLLSGKISINSKQHIIYSGTWLMRSDENDFKLESTLPVPSSFKLSHPDRGYESNSSRSFTFDGFFVTKNSKIIEQGVEIIFCLYVDNDENKVKVTGTGCNVYGSFNISGFYTVKDGETYDLDCTKVYDQLTDISRDKYEYMNNNASDDDKMSDAAEADHDELIALHEEANMSIEELCNKYYGGGEISNENVGSETAELTSNDEDDGCGF